MRRLVGFLLLVASVVAGCATTEVRPLDPIATAHARARAVGASVGERLEALGLTPRRGLDDLVDEPLVRIPVATVLAELIPGEPLQRLAFGQQLAEEAACAAEPDLVAFVKKQTGGASRWKPGEKLQLDARAGAFNVVVSATKARCVDDCLRRIHEACMAAHLRRLATLGVHPLEPARPPVAQVNPFTVSLPIREELAWLGVDLAAFHPQRNSWGGAPVSPSPPWQRRGGAVGALVAFLDSLGAPLESDPAAPVISWELDPETGALLVRDMPDRVARLMRALARTHAAMAAQPRKH